jgi:Zn-dependent protease with chaperone function
MSASHVGTQRRAHLGTWRAMAAAPSMIGSFLLLVVLFSAAGRWEGPVLLGWIAGGLLALSTPGERGTVRIVCRFRSLSAADRAQIAPTLSAVLDRSGLTPDEVDLYVRNGRSVNAYAAGRRSIAVTRQVVDRHRDGGLSDDVLAGLLSHEIGHIVTQSVRWSLIVAWFAMPWRLACRAEPGAGSPRRLPPDSLARCWLLLS